MPQAVDLQRRKFLQSSAAVGGGLLLGVQLPALAETEQGNTVGDSELTAWVRISPDGETTLVIDKSEMGQGIATALAMLLAEELEVDLESVRFEFAPADRRYINHAFYAQSTGGSLSVESSWEPMRQAGAAAREMLIAAAAQIWGARRNQCHAVSGWVEHEDGRRLPYGFLADLAATQEIPDFDELQLKEPKDFRLIGKPLDRLDNRTKVDGSARFGLDVRLPQMRMAMVLRPPVLGGDVATFDDSEALKIPGVESVHRITRGIAVVARNSWAARKGLRALAVSWTDTPHDTASSAKLADELAERANQPASSVTDQGHAEKALKIASRRLEARYQLPYLAHATMEPMNCTAHVQADRCDIWAPTQSPASTVEIASRLTGLKEDQISVTTTYLGGGFGRRYNIDFVEEAVEISSLVGQPVQLIWSREDDMRHDFYRPQNSHLLRAAINDDSQVTAWFHRIAVPSITQAYTSDLLRPVLPAGLPAILKQAIGDSAQWVSGLINDPISTHGAADLPYAFPNIGVELADAESILPIGFWRSVGNSYNGFVTESFMDEIAHELEEDPFEFRDRLLSNSPRLQQVLRTAAEKSGWGDPLPDGRARGIAAHHSFHSYVAQVAEVSLDPKNQPVVHRVTCVIDCGMVVNPDIVAAQMESAITYGLTAALYGEITVENGRVKQSNFHDYPALRIHQSPQVDVYIIASKEPPTGVGEPATPVIAPAVANALYLLTGDRIRQLPIVGQRSLT
ncbi:MAG: xanthine dehydrogenase family protein molybdopterin-binding subunit [Gammaproteobacteria bacterium]|nr:xanthine dehydrogenase family protein molybdopterin-binding subunit [Gammaproteobacteria bacterium]